MTSYEILKDKPAFKAYCRRRSTQRRKTREEVIAGWHKARAAEFKAFCRPRGMLSILKDNEYFTGGFTDIEGIEPTRAILKKQGNEFISVIVNPPITLEPTGNEPEMTDYDTATLKLLVALEQQNALLRQLAARV